MDKKPNKNKRQEMPDDWKDHRQCGHKSCQDCDDEWYEECDELVEK